jgi:hypothetical protein
MHVLTMGFFFLACATMSTSLGSFRIIVRALGATEDPLNRATRGLGYTRAR